MSKDKEVEIGQDDAGEDYEVVPVGPIRKLERRIDEMEEKKNSGGHDDELVRDVLDIMKSNQKIVNDMTESTHELKNSVEDLTHKMDDVVDNMNSFMDLLEQASEADLEGEVISDVHSRIADAVGTEMEDVAADIRESNKEVVENLQELNKSIKRSYTSANSSQVMDQSGGLNIDREERNNESGRGQKSRESRNRKEERGSSRGLDIDRGREKQEQESGSERKKKLRKRFNNMEDEK